MLVGWGGGGPKCSGLSFENTTRHHLNILSGAYAGKWALFKINLLGSRYMQSSGSLMFATRVYVPVWICNPLSPPSQYLGSAKKSSHCYSLDSTLKKLDKILVVVRVWQNSKVNKQTNVEWYVGRKVSNCSLGANLVQLMGWLSWYLHHR